MQVPFYKPRENLYTVFTTIYCLNLTPIIVCYKYVKTGNLLTTGWPRKNATLTINNFKKTRDRMKKLCALLRIEFFSEQDDTKIIKFDEGILILWPFFWGNVIFKICPSISKITIYVPNIFHCLASPGKLSALALFAEPAWIIKRSIHYVTLQHYNPGELLKETPPYHKRDFWYKRSKFLKLHCLRKMAVDSKRLRQNH